MTSGAMADAPGPHTMTAEQAAAIMRLHADCFLILEQSAAAEEQADAPEPQPKPKRRKTSALNPDSE